MSFAENKLTLKVLHYRQDVAKYQASANYQSEAICNGGNESQWRDFCSLFGLLHIETINTPNLSHPILLNHISSGKKGIVK